jgi:hypothetical protein
MNLFLDEQLSTEKTAASIARMDSNPATWSKQILQEAHRQLPFLQEYDISINLTDSAPEQGYAIGYIEVKNPTMMTPGDEMITQPVKHGRIPIIIREFELHPLDLFMKGDKSFPLTEARFRQAMFRPDEFDSPQNLPPEVSIGDNLEPPFVGNRGGFLSGGREVTSSVELPPLLYTLAPLMDNQTIEKVAAIVAGDPTMQARFRASPEAAASLGFLAGSSEMEKASSDQVWSAVVERIKPNVIQVEKLASGKFRVKWANSEAFAPQEEEMAQPQVEEMAGPEAGGLDEGENLTVSPDAAAPMPTEPEMDSKAIAEFGQWKVMSLDGRELVGWVFPQLLSFDGEPLPMSLFTNGSEYAIQGAVAGSRVGQGVNLPHSEPNGYGCFYSISEGAARATIPFQIEAVQGGEEGTIYSVSTDMGEEFQVQVVPQLQVITSMGEGMYGVPEHYGFLPLTGQLTKLVENPEELSKESEAREIADWGEVITDGSVYSLHGRPFEKLADSVKSFIDRPAAEFLLVSAGANPDEVKSKFASVGEHFNGGTFTFMNLRQITPFTEVYEDAVKTASAVRGELPQPVLLVKEAADVAVGDGTAVDAVLSLGFLTPETVSVFLSYIPYLEDTVNRLADLLMATRMGLRILNESSVRTALFSLEETLNGLKLLAQA